MYKGDLYYLIGSISINFGYRRFSSSISMTERDINSYGIKKHKQLINLMNNQSEEGLVSLFELLSSEKYSLYVYVLYTLLNFTSLKIARYPVGRTKKVNIVSKMLGLRYA